ncbi:MAG: dynamin family protein, partial [Acidimicrobiia bacterium]
MADHATRQGRDPSPVEAAALLINRYEAAIKEVQWLDVENALQRVADIRFRLNEPIRISFVGTFSVGKSSIINSLLGEPIAPVAVRPTTAVICYFRYSDSTRVRFHFRDGHVEDEGLFAYQRFSDHAKLSENEIRRIRQMSHVEVFYPNEILRDVILVDTPGFGSTAEADDAITEGHLREADAVCWVFDATQLGRGDEVKRINAMAHRFRKGATFAVINKSDEIAPSERPALKARAAELFNRLFDETFLYSAVLALDAADAGTSDHLEFALKNKIRQQVEENSDRLRAQRAAFSLAELADNDLEVLAAIDGSYLHIEEWVADVFKPLVGEQIDGLIT